MAKSRYSNAGEICSLPNNWEGCSVGGLSRLEGVHGVLQQVALPITEDVIVGRGCGMDVAGKDLWDFMLL